MIRSTVAHIDLHAIQANFRSIVDYLASQPRPSATPPGVIAVVKANAYGHGAVRVALALEEAGAEMLACADIEEAIVLRRGGVRGQILVFGALSVSDLQGLVEFGLIPTISTPMAARAVEATAREHGVRLRYHLKIDTGMHRLGFRFDNVSRTLVHLFGSPHLELEGVYTHFATADDTEHPLMEAQRRRFERVLEELHGMGARPRFRHAANSAAILRDPRVWFDLVRPGLLLYGVIPPPLTSTLELRPAMTLRSRLVAMKGLRPGDSVGYGAKFTADRPCTIGVVPAGYADGLDPRLAGRGCVLVAGRRAPIVGAVSMDMITIDVTDVPARTGDEVVLLGDQGAQSGSRIDVREMSATVGTIPWETLCRVGTRIERIYNSNDRAG